MGGLFNPTGNGSSNTNPVPGDTGMISTQGVGGQALNGIAGGLGINLSGIPFIGSMFGDPRGAAMQAALKSSGDAYGGMRAQNAQAFQNMVGDQMAALHPAQQALMQMYQGTAPPAGPSALQPTPPGAGGGAQAGSMVGAGKMQPMQGAPGKPSGMGGILGNILGMDPILGGLLGGGQSGGLPGLPGFGGK